jgi:hypothetical protein
LVRRLFPVAVLALAIAAAVSQFLRDSSDDRSSGPDNGAPGNSGEISGSSSDIAETIHVDSSHDLASDSNRGTSESPLESVSEAVRRADELNEAGLSTEVFIHSGVYRETVELPPNTKGTDSPITIRGDPKGEVVISGSDLWDEWTPAGGGLFRHEWPHRWGLAPLPPRWAESYAGDHLRANPVIRRREMVFIGGRHLTQVISMPELRRMQGSFLVSESEGFLYVHPHSGATVESGVEVATRPTLLVARERWNLTVENLSFVHAASSVQGTAVSFVDVRRVNVLNSDFSWNNWIGLRFMTSQNVVVRDSVANYNGVGGMSAQWIDDVLFENTETSHNNWRGIRGAEETAAGQPIDQNFIDFATGQKFFRLRRATFRGHRSIGNLTGGLWFDFDNADVTLEDVVLAENLTHGLFVEASQGPFRLHRNTICNNETGILIGNAADGTVSDTVIGGNELAQVYVAGSESRRVNDARAGEGMVLRSENWTIADNVVVSGEGLAIGTHLESVPWRRFVDTLRSERNEWLFTQDDQIFQVSDDSVVNLEGWRAYSGQDADSDASKTEVDCPENVR